MREGMLNLLAVSDYFIASRTFARSFSPDSDPPKVCTELARAGPGVACVTLGDRGYAAIINGKPVERPAYPVDAVDTTGCGDIFHGGFIYGLINNWGTPACFDFAAWAAAMITRKLGGRASIPAPSEWTGLQQ
jgi:ribokinase